jgi:hypothetical protein
MLTELMLVSGYVFWIVFGLVVLFELAMFATDQLGTATFVGMAALVAAILFTDAFNGVTLLAGAIAVPIYVAAGVAWALWKWRGFLLEALADARKNYEHFNRTRTNDLQKMDWPLFLKGATKPTASKNKSLLVAWMVFWPLFLSWDLLTYPRRLFVWIYERMTTVFDRMADSIFDAPDEASK